MYNLKLQTILLNITELLPMNFLNKKHVQSFPNTMSHFNPTLSANKPMQISQQTPQLHHTGTYISNRIQQNKANRIKQSPKKLYPNGLNSRQPKQAPQSSYSQGFALKSSPSQVNMSLANLCPDHQNQVLRHLCLQCNQLLCSECISDHLQGHRQTTKTIPKIQTINKLRKQMNIKAQKILHFMEQNNPKIVLPDINQLKFDALHKIHEMKTQVIRVFEQWCRALEAHVVEDLLKTDELEVLGLEMTKIKEEVLTLYNQMMGQQNPNAETVKKVHQIDSEKLQAAYLEMFNKFSKSVLKSKFVFEYDWKGLMESFDKNLTLKPLHSQIPISAYENKADMADLPVKINKMERKSEKELMTYLTSPVVATEIRQDEDKKFIDIQSIESMIEPMEGIQMMGERVSINSGPSMGQQTREGGGKVERGFSRQGSGKRLSIFNVQQKVSQNQNSHAQ